ncbi:hypothetical protein IEQ34_006649 [Dendrobium chrysotoxum]|uniref:G-patch domain-containing protein n=1 Tax=Dendrobium chrysotoxum TaxID=161865 RepID=A0AAV7H8R4_DENCH|nr:hypothetical protein IEQ34_006649 [Dendrobium chrysotoxum]
MDGQRFKLTGGPFSQVGQRREGEEVTVPLAEAHLDSSAKDSVEDFRLPINHRPVENLVVDDLEQASLDTQLTSSNIGYRLLQRMGWKGKGLGKDEQGIVEPIKAGIRDPKLVELEETEELAKKREVIAEREQKIQTEVKEIKKVFFCNLCNKQYKLAVEFEAHLSSYDHNHRKRFKEMREMRASSSRDDRQKKEQLRQEKEVAKFAAQMASSRRQHQQVQEQSEVQLIQAREEMQLQQTLKFGFTSKLGSTKNSAATAAKKAKIAVKVTSVFGNDSDEES